MVWSVRVSVVTLAGLVAGCDARLGGSDETGDGGMLLDGAADMLVPDVQIDAPLGPWLAPSPIGTGANPAVAEDDLTLATDELELIFAGVVMGGTGKQLFTMARAALGDPWGEPTLITELEVANSNNQAPRLSADGLSLYFGSSRAGGAAQDVWVATRVARGQRWAAPTLVDGVNSPASDRWYGVCGNGERYVMVSDRGGVGLDLFEGVVGQPPSLIVELSSEQADLSPLLSDDCLSMHFSSNRGGTFQLYVSQRAALTAPWGAPVLVEGIPVDGTDDQDPWISPDQRRLYFASNRDGEYDLYVANR